MRGTATELELKYDWTVCAPSIGFELPLLGGLGKAMAVSADELIKVNLSFLIVSRYPLCGSHPEADHVVWKRKT